MSFIKKTSKVIFICTGNSARSIMGEIAANTLTNNKFIGYSAGSNPTGAINSAALSVAEEINYPLETLKSKNINLFLGDEHHFDLSITVCDNAKDNCPVFLNSSKSLHWSYPDPAAITDFESRKMMLLEIYYDLGKRLNQLCTKH